MDDYIYIVIAAISLISITSLSFVIYLINKGNSTLLYNIPYDNLRRKWHTVLLALAVLTLITIFYQGAMYVMSWLPILFDDSGYRLAEAISSIFTVMVGGALILFLVENLTWKSDRDFRNEMIRALNETVDDLTYHREATYIKAKLEDNIKKIVSENQQPDQNQLASTAAEYTLISRRVGFYRELAGKVSRLENSEP